MVVAGQTCLEGLKTDNCTLFIGNLNKTVRKDSAPSEFEVSSKADGDERGIAKETRNKKIRLEVQLHNVACT